jgi:ribosomal protein S6--L-glutamate ligase
MAPPLRIAILSRNKNLHSIRRLLQEARKAEVVCDVINPLECQLVVDGKNSRILYGSAPLPRYDAVLPRIGASITSYGLAVVKQFEVLGMTLVNGSGPIADSRDKMQCLQILTQAGLQVPASALSRSQRGLRFALDAVGGAPVVLKVLEGTQGVGVMIADTQLSAASIVDAVQGMGQDVILQRFLSEGAGRDYRAFVVGNRVVAAMMRTAPEGEFRSNIHRGGSGKLVQLPRKYQEAAVKAVRVLNLQIAGVDLMDSGKPGRSAPLILEVNSSPGFEGIERATGMNVAAVMMKQVVAAARKKKRA